MSDDTQAGGIAARLAARWAAVMQPDQPRQADDTVARAAAATAPVIWLLGKVQSGKSSIVQAMTGATTAEIGSGFRPCTRTADIFDFPSQSPVIRFLDTRGLGEAGYDPAEDLALAEGRAHLLLVVMRALDPQQDEVLATLARVRSRRPDWPVIVAQTCLHDAYVPGTGEPAGRGHVLPYPFVTLTAETPPGDATAPGNAHRVPEDLIRSLAYQRDLVASMGYAAPVHFVPLDFTQPGDGFEPRLYGYDALVAAILEAAPAAIAATMRELGDTSATRAARRASPTILGYAAAAATADIVPLAGAVAVPGIQARLLQVLADQVGVAWNRRTLGEFGACLGAGILARLAARYGIRQLVKLVPVYGQTVGAAAAAASSFATTYALGKAALVFLGRRDRGQTDPGPVVQAFHENLAKAFGMARERGIGETQGSPTSQGDAEHARQRR